MQALKTFCQQEMTCGTLKNQSSQISSELCKRRKNIKKAILEEIEKIKTVEGARYKIMFPDGVRYLRLCTQRTYHTVTKEMLDQICIDENYDGQTLEELVQFLTNAIQKIRTIIQGNSIVVSTTVPRKNVPVAQGNRRLEMLAQEYFKTQKSIRDNNKKLQQKINSHDNRETKQKVINFFTQANKESITVKLRDGTYRVVKEIRNKPKKIIPKKQILKFFEDATNQLELEGGTKLDTQKAKEIAPKLLNYLTQQIENMPRETYEYVGLKRCRKRTKKKEE